MAPPGKQKYTLKQYVKSRITWPDRQGNVCPLPPEANFALPISCQHPIPCEEQTADKPGINLSFLPPRLTQDGDTVGKPFDTGKPTCSINLLCHRNGILQKYQVQVISKDRCAGPNQYNSLIASNKRLIKTDIQFFKAVKKTYEKEMYGIWRTLFYLKTLREIRLVSFTPYDHRPIPAFLPEYVKQDILFAYKYPEKLYSDREWIHWVYNLRQPDRRYALEFVESWSSPKILVALSVLLASSTALGIAWAVVKDDAQTAFSIASFVLGAGSLILAALALVSSIEASTTDGSSQSNITIEPSPRASDHSSMSDKEDRSRVQLSAPSVVLSHEFQDAYLEWKTLHIPTSCVRPIRLSPTILTLYTSPTLELWRPLIKKSFRYTRPRCNWRRYSTGA
ncbi:hypothetical protein PHISCL_07774 [Aspergillus sclerotialis]|uniref:Uncharacterized protein n=1 Tax=Aspergillus sclerotialis TaxID=2070753 RepID=A0A3A2ZC73_9EURO|nr:hypothetical protein PHISCL_07774 [Aspergillus sclerotialis]